MAISLNGAGWYSLAGLFATSDSFTIMGWVLATSIPVNYTNVLSVTSQVALGILNSGPTNWNIGHPVADQLGTSTPVINVWYHVAMTKAATTYTLFINGNQEVSGTNAEASGTGLTIGDFNNIDGGDEWFGSISAVKVWKGAGSENALDKSQIQTEMRYYMPVRKQGVAAVYPMEPKGLSAALIDYSGFGRNLTLGGSGHAVAEGPALAWAPKRRRVFGKVATAAATDTQEWRGSYPTPRRSSFNIGY